jgi:hypothetical protein
MRVRMFFVFSVCRLIYRAEFAENEAALMWTSSNFAKIDEEDALLATGASAGEVFSLGSLTTQLRKRSHRYPIARRRGPGARCVLALFLSAQGTYPTCGLLPRR